MSNTKELEQEILEKMFKKLNLDREEFADFTYDSPIFESDAGEDDCCLCLDSLDALELVVLIYERWGVTVEEGDVSKLRSVTKIADYIRSSKGEA